MMSIDVWTEKIAGILAMFESKYLYPDEWFHDGPYSVPWEEIVCMLYDDLDFENFINMIQDTGSLSARPRELFVELKKILDPLVDRYDEASSLVADSHWSRVEQLSGQILTMLKTERWEDE